MAQVFSPVPASDLGQPGGQHGRGPCPVPASDLGQLGGQHGEEMGAENPALEGSLPRPSSALRQHEEVGAGDDDH